MRRNVHVSHESSAQGTLGRDTRDARDTSAPSPKPPLVGSRNVAGPAVYYPPGHTPFQKKEGGGYQASSVSIIMLIVIDHLKILVVIFY